MAVAAAAISDPGVQLGPDPIGGGGGADLGDLPVDPRLLQLHPPPERHADGGGLVRGRVVQNRVVGGLQGDRPGGLGMEVPEQGVLGIEQVGFGGDDVLLLLGHLGFGGDHFDRGQGPHPHLDGVRLQELPGQFQGRALVGQVPTGEDQVPVMGFGVLGQLDDGLLEGVVRGFGAVPGHHQIDRCLALAAKPLEQVLGVAGAQAAAVRAIRASAARGTRKPNRAARVRPGAGAVVRLVFEPEGAAPLEPLVQFPAQGTLMGDRLALHRRALEPLLQAAGFLPASLGVKVKFPVEGAFTVRHPGPGRLPNFLGDGHLEVVLEGGADRLLQADGLGRQGPGSLGGQAGPGQKRRKQGKASHGSNSSGNQNHRNEGLLNLPGMSASSGPGNYLFMPSAAPWVPTGARTGQTRPRPWIIELFSGFICHDITRCFHRQLRLPS